MKLENGTRESVSFLNASCLMLPLHRHNDLFGALAIFAGGALFVEQGEQDQRQHDHRAEQDCGEGVQQVAHRRALHRRTVREGTLPQMPRRGNESCVITL